MKLFLKKIHYIKLIFKYNELEKFHSADIILLGNDHDRSFTIFDKKYSQILDSLDFFLKEHKLLALHLALPIATNYGSRTFGNALSLNGKFVRAKIIFKILKLFTKNKINPIVNLWCEVINKVKPRCIIGINPPPELCIAAKNSGILIFDIQHGVLSSEGYYGNQYRKDFFNNGWPDYILCWNQSSVEWVLNNCKKEFAPILIGNPWFIRFTDPNVNDFLVSTFNKNNFLGQPYLANILVSLQWGFDENKTILGIPSSLFKYIKSNGEKYNWKIRIHPIMLNDNKLLKQFETEFHLYNNIEWMNCSSDPLPLVLEDIDLHFTSHSALTIEASWYGIKTGLMLDNPYLLKEYFAEQLESNLADIISNEVVEIENWIISNLNRKKTRSKNFINSSKKLVSFISSL